MSDLEFTERQARAFLSRRLELVATECPAFGVYWCYRGEPADYQFFIVRDLDEQPHCGGARYLMVHKITGEVHDLRTIGE